MLNACSSALCTGAVWLQSLLLLVENFGEAAANPIAVSLCSRGVFACICGSGCFCVILILSFHFTVLPVHLGLRVFVWGLFVFTFDYTPLGPALSSPSLKQRFVLGYCLTCFAKVFIFCNADTKILS